MYMRATVSADITDSLCGLILRISFFQMHLLSGEYMK